MLVVSIEILKRHCEATAEAICLNQGNIRI